MSVHKRRMTVTVDPELVEVGQRAVETGDAASFSAWVSEALKDKIRRDHSLLLLADAVADFEREFGEITPQEIAAQQRADRRDATVVRGRPKRSAARPVKSA